MINLIKVTLCSRELMIFEQFKDLILVIPNVTSENYW